MKNITLRQLRYFDAVASHGHFGRAADACAVSQPALSVQIKELENSLGSPLFERLPRRLRLTTLGRVFLERSRLILQNVDELGDLARAAKDSWIGQLRLGVIPTIAPYILPAVVTELSKAYGDIDLHINEAMTASLISDLTEGRIDTAIVALPISEPHLTEVALFDETFMLVRPEADKNQPVPDKETLKEMKLLLLEEGHCFRDQALSFCDIQSQSPRETMDGSSLSTLVQMVGVGLGVTLLPEMAIKVETRSADVSIARFAAPEPTRTIGMVWRKTSPLHSHYLNMSQIVRAAAQPG